MTLGWRSTPMAARSKLLRAGLLAGGLLFAMPALAASVTYSLSSGALTTVQFIDLTTGQPSPCPIGGSNCLGAALALTGGTIQVDEAAGTLLSLSVSSTNTGVLSMGGFSGYSTVSFSNLSFVTNGPTALFSNGSVGSANLYSFGPASGTVTTDLAFSFVAGGTASVPGVSFAAGPIGSMVIDQGGAMSLSLSGVNLGVLCDPLNPSACVLVKADFHLGASPAIPEPNAAAVFGAGLVFVCASLARRRTA